MPTCELAKAELYKPGLVANFPPPAAKGEMAELGLRHSTRNRT